MFLIYTQKSALRMTKVVIKRKFSKMLIMGISPFRQAGHVGATLTDETSVECHVSEIIFSERSVS